MHPHQRYIDQYVMYAARKAFPKPKKRGPKVDYMSAHTWELIQKRQRLGVEVRKSGEKSRR